MRSPWAFTLLCIAIENNALLLSRKNNVKVTVMPQTKNIVSSICKSIFAMLSFNTFLPTQRTCAAGDRNHIIYYMYVAILSRTILSGFGASEFLCKGLGNLHKSLTIHCKSLTFDCKSLIHLSVLS